MGHSEYTAVSGTQQLSLRMPTVDPKAWKYWKLEPLSPLETKMDESAGRGKLSALRPER